jgi:hypothetical protein
MELSCTKEISDPFYFIDLFPKKNGNNALGREYNSFKALSIPEVDMC